MAGIDALAKSALQSQGQSGGVSSPGNPGSRNIYPAIVMNAEDSLGMKRVVAKIISLDEKGEINGGKDNDVTDVPLSWEEYADSYMHLICVPMMPNHFHIVPIVGEMVYVFLSNPSDRSAQRFYIGSQINSPFKLKFQAYEDADRVFKNTKFNLNKQQDSNLEILVALPKPGDIAIQGRSDADLILKPREVVLVAGKFDKGTNNINKTTPSTVQLIQLENEDKEGLIASYSQGNLTSTNVNIFSVRGKFRDASLADFELNEDLKSFGDLAGTLHPAVFGDELIKLLDIIVRVMLTHIHTPQLPLVQTPESAELAAYTVQGELQKIISNHIRIN